MNQSKINDILLQYEISGVDKDLDIDGFTCWIKIKNDIFTYLTKDTISIGVKRKRFYNFYSITFYLYNIVCLFKTIFSSKGQVFIHTALSGISGNKDLFTDSLRERYNSFLYFINIGEIERVKKNKKFFKDNLVFSDNFFLWPFKYIGTKLFIYFLPKKTKKSILKMIEFFESKDVNVSYNLIASSLVTYVVGYYFYYYLFKIIKPSRCYIISAYSKSEVCAASRKHSILVTEIQHGLVGVEHRGYNYYNQCMPQGSALPTPDKLVVTNEFWKKELINAGYFSQNEIIVGGNYKLSKVNTEHAFDFRYFIFSGQGIDYESLKSFYNKSLDYLLLNNVILIYKPHPRENISEVKNIFSNCSSIQVYAGEESTETLIYHSIAHVSFYSSCHFDAVEMKGKTFVLKSSLSLLMNRYIETYPDEFLLINYLGENDGF